MSGRYQYPVKTSLVVVIMNTLVVGITFFSIWNFLTNNVSEFRFENTSKLWWLVILPMFSVAYLLYTTWQNRALKQIADSRLRPSLVADVSGLRSNSRYLLMHTAIFLVIIAFANPQYGTQKAEGKSKGSEIMIALDISNSMLAEDQGNQMNRLQTAKLAIYRLLPRLTGDKIGIVIFAGDAFIQVPMTNDYNAVKQFLQPVDPGFISGQGTAIGQAIETSLTSFTQNFKGSKAIIVISDGENHEDDAAEAAANAASLDVTVHTIGIGSAQGSPIPVYENGVKKGLKRDENGNTVVTHLNEKMLAEIAQFGKGTYTKARSTQFGLETLLEKIRKMHKVELSTSEFTAYDDQFGIFLLGAIILLLIEPCIVSLRNPKKNQWV